MPYHLRSTPLHIHGSKQDMTHHRTAMQSIASKLSTAMTRERQSTVTGIRSATMQSSNEHGLGKQCAVKNEPPAKDDGTNNSESNHLRSKLKRRYQKAVKIEYDISESDRCLDVVKNEPVEWQSTLNEHNQKCSKRNIEQQWLPAQNIKLESTDVWMPKHWQEQLANIRKMRSLYDAPVDTMGCDRISDRAASPKDFRYQVLLSLLLSSQTKDEQTSAAMARLKEHGCSVANILETSDEKLGQLIYPVSFWKTKTKHIKQSSAILKSKYDCDIPSTLEELMVLPGIGPKMAHLIMQCAWNVTTGLAVDTHVFRITQRLGWVKRPQKKPEDLRKAIEEWLPRNLWPEINWLLVGFGQQICSAVKPKCQQCLNINICTYPSLSAKTKADTGAS